MQQGEKITSVETSPTESRLLYCVHRWLRGYRGGCNLASFSGRYLGARVSARESDSEETSEEQNGIKESLKRLALNKVNLKDQIIFWGDPPANDEKCQTWAQGPCWIFPAQYGQVIKRVPQASERLLAVKAEKSRRRCQPRKRRWNVLNFRTMSEWHRTRGTNEFAVSLETRMS